MQLKMYWWKGIANAVAERCDVCQHVNSCLGKVKAELQPIPITDVWKQIAIDLIGMATVTVYTPCAPAAWPLGQIAMYPPS